MPTGASDVACRSKRRTGDLHDKIDELAVTQPYAVGVIEEWVDLLMKWGA